MFHVKHSFIQNGRVPNVPRETMTFDLLLSIFKYNVLR